MRRDAYRAIFFIIFFHVLAAVAMKNDEEEPLYPFGWNDTTRSLHMYSDDTVEKIERLKRCYNSLRDGFLNDFYRESRLISLERLIDLLKTPAEACTQGKRAELLYSDFETELTNDRVYCQSTRVFDRDVQQVRALLHEIIPKLCPVIFFKAVEIEIAMLPYNVK